MASAVILYGISSYKTVAQEARESYVYVDKTMYIEKLENPHSPFHLFCAPGDLKRACLYLCFKLL